MLHPRAPASPSTRPSSSRWPLPLSLPLALGLATAACTEPPDDPPPISPCATGSFIDQVLPDGDGVEPRAYFLHVPSGYTCDEPIGLVVDFHDVDLGPRPETTGAQAALVALAEARRVIVARARARAVDVGGDALFAWDANDGDVARNAAFAANLVDALRARYPVDPARTYALGTGSGAGMAAELLGEARTAVAGVAAFGGGARARPLATVTPPPRLFVAAGYRELAWPHARALVADALAAGWPVDRVWLRTHPGEVRVGQAQLDEAIAFLDEGARPAPGALAAGWTREPLPEADGVDVTGLVADGAGLLAVGSQGRIWHRDAAAWTLERARQAEDYVAACAGPGGALVVGGAAAARRSGGAWQDVTLPPDETLGVAWSNAVACRDDGTSLAAGFWSAALSADAGASWAPLAVPSTYGFEAVVAGAATAPGGATVLVGDGYIGRLAPGATEVTPIEAPEVGLNAVTAVAGGRFWAVGEDGVILASTDDGRTWAPRTSGTTADLEAVHFADAQRGLAVGARGTVVETFDGGATWAPRALGLTADLAAVHVGATELWVAGAGGLLARAPR